MDFFWIYSSIILLNNLVGFLTSFKSGFGLFLKLIVVRLFSRLLYFYDRWRVLWSNLCSHVLLVIFYDYYYYESVKIYKNFYLNLFCLKTNIYSVKKYRELLNETQFSCNHQNLYYFIAFKIFTIRSNIHKPTPFPIFETLSWMEFASKFCFMVSTAPEWQLQFGELEIIAWWWLL